MTYFLTPAHKTLDPDTDAVISTEWGMLDSGVVISALAVCPFGLATLGSSDTQFGVSVPDNPQGLAGGVLGPWTAPTGWTPSTLAEIQTIFGGA